MTTQKRFELTTNINVVYPADKVNGISRQADQSLGINFSYENSPQPDSINAFLGSQNFTIPDSIAETSIFIMTEPPEIQRYDPSDLRRFWRVLGPGFHYLKKLQNLVVAGGVVPWRIGVAHEAGRPKPTLTRSQISGLPIPTGATLTAVISGKSSTKGHRARIRIASDLARQDVDMSLYGRDGARIDDKIDAHFEGAFHLAIENSRHPYYFTEKLTDALLAGNHVFYGGHPSSVMPFRKETITLIDFRLPPQVWRRKIIRTIRDYRPELHLEAKLENRRRVLETQNLHSHLAKILEAASR